MAGGGIVGAGSAERAGGGTKEVLGAGAVGAFLAPMVVAKFITSNVGRKFLMSGFPAVEKAVSRAVPYTAIGARGMFGREGERQEKPVVRGGPPLQSRAKGGPVTPDITGEIDWAMEAVNQGADPLKIRGMFRDRTGQEL